MNYFTKHLNEAKVASGSAEPVTVGYYIMHGIVSVKQGVKYILLGCAGIVHAFFPWWFGFELIDIQINGLKALKKALPGLPVWDRIEFKD